ncbi:hypothetical protein BDQ12DRAFT_673046 [Crucibulum laeve]|uniref:Uncharacterized protein n=1 Tax=Crucibulum laeve TaxID=68775 RepID=A0A5C3MIG3_9AGAR|nr:hypothetical protein BDQ12DRAFT_673046 [Crucibulum laeve]
MTALVAHFSITLRRFAGSYGSQAAFFGNYTLSCYFFVNNSISLYVHIRQGHAGNRWTYEGIGQ